MPADRLEELVWAGTDPSPVCLGEQPLRNDRFGLLAERAARHLASLQKNDGHWVAELEGDCILESEYILLMAFLGREKDPDFFPLPDTFLITKTRKVVGPNFPVDQVKFPGV